jgi:Transposase
VPSGRVRSVPGRSSLAILLGLVIDVTRTWTYLGHRGRKPDPLCRIRKLLLTAAEQLTGRGRVRLRAGLAAGDPGGEVVAAWQGKELLRAVYATNDLARARAALDRFYHWTDGVQLPELSRLARTVKAWEAEILAFHATGGCSNGHEVRVWWSCMLGSPPGQGTVAMLATAAWRRKRQHQPGKTAGHVEMAGLEPAAFCLQSIQRQAACYAAKTQGGGEHEPSS